MITKRAGPILVLLAACTPVSSVGPAVQPIAKQNVEVRDFLAIVPQIVHATAPSHGSGVPLLLDLQSFVTAANSGLGLSLEKEEVAGAVGRAFQDVVAEAAIIKQSEYRYVIFDGGRHVQLDRFVRRGSGYEAIVTQSYTEERGQNSAIGQRTVALSFELVAGVWRLQSQRLIGTS